MSNNFWIFQYCIARPVRCAKQKLVLLIIFAWGLHVDKCDEVPRILFHSPFAHNSLTQRKKWDFHVWTRKTHSLQKVRNRSSASRSFPRPLCGEDNHVFTTSVSWCAPQTFYSWRHEINWLNLPALQLPGRWEKTDVNHYTHMFLRLLGKRNLPECVAK